METERKINSEEMTIEDAIDILRNLKERTRQYAELYSYYPISYTNQLAALDSRAIDTVIEALKNRE